MIIVQIVHKEKGEAMKKTREEAWVLLKEYNQQTSLQKHALAVEAVMAYFAKERGEDVAYWSQVGLLHDLDYEQYPEIHCQKTREILEKEGYEEPFIRAIESHGYGICTEVVPEHPMEKVLYTIDELTGLIHATVLMRPDHSISTLPVKSVLKKFKNLKFAQGVDRQVILQGCTFLEEDLEKVVEKVIEGMKEAKEALGFL